MTPGETSMVSTDDIEVDMNKLTAEQTSTIHYLYNTYRNEKSQLERNYLRMQIN